MEIGNDWVDVTVHLEDSTVVQAEGSIGIQLLTSVTKPVSGYEALVLEDGDFLNYVVPAGEKKTWARNMGKGFGNLKSGVN